MDTTPADVLHRLTDEIVTTLSDDLLGLYAYGSLVTGDFAAERSDLDLLAVLRADPTTGVSDDAAGRRLGRAIRGWGAFRRFKDELFEEHPDLVSAWHDFHDARANRRAVEWLHGQGLIRDDAARKFLVDDPDPDLP